MSVHLLSTNERYRSERLTFALERFDTPDGTVERAVVHHPGAVAMLAQPTPETLVLVRQWRYALGRETLEVPAGTRTMGEAPEATAERELREEAGFSCRSLRIVLRFHPAPGLSDEEMILYRAEGLVPASGQRDRGELIAPEVVPVAELARLISDGRITDGKTLIAIACLGIGMPRG